MGNQTLEYAEEFQLELSCPFNFTKFPFDSHVCHVEYMTYEHYTPTVTLKPSVIEYGNINTTFGGMYLFPVNTVQANKNLLILILQNEFLSKMS